MSARQVQNNRLVARKTAIAQVIAQLFVGSLMLGAAMPASAASCTWNPANGNWNAVLNWVACATGNGNPVGTPGAADSVAIAAAKTVTINTGQSILNLSNAGTVNIDAFGLNLVGGGSTTNTGTINVGGPSTANIGVSGGHNINNTGGTINIANGSVVNHFGSTITGGAIATSGTGALVAFSSSNVLSGVTLNGTLDMATNASSRERIANGLTVNGVVNVSNGGILSFDSSLTTGLNQTIGGAGTINLNDSAARITLEGTGTTTIGSGLTIRGQGSVTSAVIVGGVNNLVNNGLISADVNATTLNLAPGGTITNSGTLSAQNGGTLILSSNLIGNPSGQIVAGAGSTVRQSGVRISGTINTSGAGTFAAASAANILDAVTLNGTLDMTSITNARERVANGLTFTPGSVINVANGGILSFDSSLTTGSNQTIGGAGTINLNDSTARITLEGTGTTTIGSGLTIRGQGAITNAVIVPGVNNLVNNGLISADVNATTLNLAPGGTITNNGTLSAQNGGTLILSSNLIGNPSGQIVAGTGSTVLQNGVTLAGTLNTSGSGRFAASANGSNFLSGVTLNGNLDLATATGFERVTAGGLVLNGTINLNNNSGLVFNDTGGLSGNGTIVLGNTGSSNRIGLDGNGITTLAAGTTIRGHSGTIGNTVFVGGAQTLVNNGTINADVTGGIINISGAALTNNGLVRAQAGTINVSSVLTGTGSLQVDAAGVMNLAAGAKSQGTLAMGAAGAALNLNTGNLTLNTDYTNVGAGSGNAFNRRAGVTGAGLIVAGGNAAQAITGAGVTNGNTTNATLTLGNVRVGATTFNYQVANTGTTGPSLRGAIQTNVNGASLTDGRLSGAGVTASNYNTGAPGSNTGNLGVTFTAAGPGLLAPMNGQVLNLRSNFENIADQKLNIVLAAGATAFNVAGGNANPSPATVANQRVGGSNFTTLTVTNSQVPSVFTEDLNASFGASTGAASGSGSIAGRLAGAVNSNTGIGAMTVAVNTATAGAKTGTVTLNYETAGAVNGVSNVLGTASVGSQTITVNGNVYQVAQPTALPANVTLGNFRAGTAQSQTVTLTNTNISPAGFQEGLNATIGTLTGAATGTGGLNNVAAGNSGSLQIGVTGAAGINTGTVQVQLATNGTGTSGLGNLDLGAAQTINVSGTGYRLAQPNTIAPINFGNVLANSVQTRTVTISNGATADGFSEALNAAFGSLGGTNAASFSGAGAISGLLAGGSNNTSMVVTLNTTAAGTKTANIQILLDSNGTAIGNGLGLSALPTQTINLDGVIGVVGNLASAGLSPLTVNFGKFREGAANQTQQLTVTNLTSGPGEGLNASFGAASGGASNNGATITSLATSASNNTSMNVTLGGLATAGAKSGVQTVNFVSDGSFNAGVPTPLPSQNVSLSAEVYRLAALATTLVSPINTTLAARVGGAAPSSNITVTNASVDGFTEGLNVVRGATAAGFTSSGGPITNLAANASSSAIGVTLNTATAGTFIGGQLLALASNGTITGNSNVALGSVTHGLVGKVYTTAVAQVNTASPINFGIVHVGDVVALKNVSITNNTGATALGDSLVGSISATGPFSGSGTLGAGVAANATDATSLKVGLNTSTAGIFNAGIASLSLASHNPDMADQSLGITTVGLNAQVNNYANLNTIKVSGLGSFSRSGNVFTLDFGNVLLGSGLLSASLNVLNDVAGPADEADGSYCLPGAPCSLDSLLDFALSGFNPFADVGAGGTASNLSVGLSTAALGLFQDDILLAGFGHNASGFGQALDGLTLRIRGNVINQGNSVPEPGTLALLLLAAAGAVLARRRRGVVVQ